MHMATEKENKEEELVSFIDDDAETVVDLSPKEERKTDNTNDRLAAAEAETARLCAQIDADRTAAYGANRSQPTDKDPFDDELNAVNERQKALGIQWELDKAAGKFRGNQFLVDEYEKKARDIEDQKSQIYTNRAIRQALPAITQAQQRQQLEAQYSDVYNNRQAITYAEGAYKMLLASGEQDGPQLLDKAMNQARIQFKMPGANYMKPTQSDKDKLAGIPGGGG